MSFYSKNLRDGEQIISVIRRSWINNIFRYFLAFLLFIVPFFFMFPLLAWGIIGQIIFSLLLAVAVLYLLKLISLAYYNCLVITTQRLIDFDQKKTFERQVKETDFIDITEVSYKIKGLWQIISKSGTLAIKTKSSAETPLMIKNMSQPEKIQNLILELRDLAREEARIKNGQQAVRENYQEVLRKMKKEVGEDGLNRLMRSLTEENIVADEEEKKVDKDLEFLK